ncbi:MAG: helix-turn-helix domain-containing protein [Phycisphaerales bacterium JB065]
MASTYAGVIAAQAREKMEAKGMSQQALADEIGVRKATINEFLNGNPGTSIAIVEAAMDILKIRLRP